MGASILDKGMRRGPLGFFSGVWAVPWGLGRILRDAKLKQLLVVPLLLTSVVYVIGAYLLIRYAPGVMDWLWHRPDGGWLEALWILALIALYVLATVIAFLLFATVAEAVGGPFYDKMVKHVLASHGIASTEPSFWAGTIPDLVRSLVFLAFVLGCALLGLIPVIGVVFVVIGSILGWLGLAASATNSVLAMTGHSGGRRLGYLFSHFFPMLGLGAVMGLGMLVPGLAVVVIPAGLVGATELYARGART